MHYRVIGLSCVCACDSAGRMDTRRYDVHQHPVTAEAAYALDTVVVVAAAVLAVPRVRQMGVVEGRFALAAAAHAQRMVADRQVVR